MNNFDRIAPIYDRLASLVFWGNINRAARTWLGTIPVGSHVLIIGGGSGQVLEDLCLFHLDLKITYIESSPKMIYLAQKRNLGSNKVHFVCDTFPNAKTDQLFDVVIVSYFLDLFSPVDLKIMIRNIYDLLYSDGMLLVTDFHIYKRNYFHQIMTRCMHIFFRVCADLQSRRLQDIHQELLNHGFVLKNSKLFFQRFIFSATYFKENNG
ncbi:MULTISPECIES: class I SAM-dependent methyltransferase [Reichenbachiella]|uniref:class I SAM-dependent methyltransferase n=1 Tax=Reichenbachiella TaxID=156993 RepID=UPI000E6C04E7|nr:MULTISPECIES: class I SAM-dependent methyltransferase [Reichenbachiella]MBU2914790.1 class I SAM-dependent methyltransferase [Reichenbachiella agariperforans]RJE71183.1 hypothetical protein BGP76_08500 [Reichenbachiella sp. MSK19-1]